MKKVAVLCTIFMLFFSGSAPTTRDVHIKDDNPLIRKLNELNSSIELLNRIWDEKGR